MPPSIEVQHLVKRYKKGDRNAVDDVSFTVEPGQLFALLGPNGAGKTTIVSILTTTLTPTSGRASILGLDVATQASQVRRKVGIIFQNPSLDLNLTAEENIRLHATLYGLYPFRPTYAAMPDTYRQEVKRLADIIGLGSDVFKPMKQFSGGMKRKLEIIRSLIHSPKVLFLDEPTIGLDPASRRNLWEYLTTVRNGNGMTIFLTTHYLEEAEQSDMICIINQGKVAAYGTPEALKAQLVAQSYLLVDSADREGLRTELTRAALPFEETPRFKISLASQSAQQIIRRIETPLSLVKTHIPTLEDAYLSIVDNDND
ncbi:MAG: ABC transporter ATP-binding protein [Chloroflexi bacterium]|nr:ABC transporter ATP-binding protein [Chloroflexota bacterium]